MPGGDDDKPISLFYSYSHKDEHLRERLEEQLVVLRRAGLITGWNDREIVAGDDWKGRIDHHLNSADVILCLVSPSFIASDYCWDKEMKKALERHAKEEAIVIPVILRPCHWQDTELANVQALPRDARPVTQWPDQDDAFYDITQGIRRAILELRRKRAAAAAVTVVATTVPLTPSPPPSPPAAPASPSRIADFAVFRDVDEPWCPEMVALPAGEFLMGSPDSEKERYGDEGPQHRVQIGYRFALGRHPVTVGEYRRFADSMRRADGSGIRVWDGKEWKEDAAKSWRDPGFAQTERHPVVGVSWGDAQAYVEWLAKETRQPYRLPSEAEWEYACRAGTRTRYAFGDEITGKQANFGRKVDRTTEVGAYPANPWGLCDMHGNAFELVDDVWHNSYQGAPADGSAWTGGEGLNSSRIRVSRGGSWGNCPGYCRSAYRYGLAPDIRNYGLGFRVARTLS